MFFSFVHRHLLFAAGAICAAVAASAALSFAAAAQPETGATGPRAEIAEQPQPSSADSCPAARVVEIRGSDAAWRQLLTVALQCENTEVRLGPDVDMTFHGVKWSIPGDPPEVQFPLILTKCVKLRSVSAFDRPAPPAPPSLTCGRPQGGQTDGGVILGPTPTRSAASTETAGVERSGADRGGPPGGAVTGDHDLAVEPRPDVGSARTPRSQGPRLVFGGNHARPENPDEWGTFMEIPCFPPDGPFHDGVRISGFRLEGPRLGKGNGIHIIKCVDVHVSNMEISGWDVGVGVVDDEEEAISASNQDAGRLRQANQIRIFNSYFHHNEHASEDGHAGGYGVVVSPGAWASISENVFDSNRHAIAANGHSGGYDARRNLVLKGGGYHGTVVNEYTHQFDVHGTHNCKAYDTGVGILGGLLAVVAVVVALVALSLVSAGTGLAIILVSGGLLAAGGVVYVIVADSIWNCGYAGFEVRYDQNAFQYDRDAAIKVRGTPRKSVEFSGNVFPHDEVYDVRGITGGWGQALSDAAIALFAGQNVIMHDNNVGKVDTFGNYEVCDFDGDGVDDLFLATGATWWYSSGGRSPWSYMNAQRVRSPDLAVGYFDDDQRCDVLAARPDGTWLYVSGGYGDWRELGDQSSARFGVREDGRTPLPLAQVQFGRFDPQQMDSRTGTPTRRITHALRRRADTQWEVTALDRPNWSATLRGQSYASSSIVWEKLKFGDFTGDGVTDVLAVTSGQWQISESAQGTWRPINPLNDDVSRLIVANLDADDNIDDLIRLDKKSLGSGSISCNWMRSRNGVGSWEPFHSQTLSFPSGGPVSSGCRGFAGRFNPVSGGGGAVMVIEAGRIGRFFSEQAKTAANPSGEFSSKFQY